MPDSSSSTNSEYEPISWSLNDVIEPAAFHHASVTARTLQHGHVTERLLVVSDLFAKDKQELLEARSNSEGVTFPITADLFLSAILHQSFIAIRTFMVAFKFIVFLACFYAIATFGLAQTLIVKGENHFSDIRQLTFGGENAEGYFSFDESRIIFQSTHGEFKCDQEFVMNLASGETHMVSTGKGRTTCGYFFPDDRKILFSSTHLQQDSCPPPPDYSNGYVWMVSPEYDIFTANPDGSDLKQFTTTPGYDAEATISPVGDRIVFTSVRNGDLDVYSMNLDGSDVKQLTNEIGYDGGPYFSWDGMQICYRGWHYTDSAEITIYKDLLSKNLVRPTRMEIMIMNKDGSNKRQITNNGAANFAPFFHPDNKRIIFASNMADAEGRNFDLYIVNVDGSGLERVTYNETFDSFPMFTRDGRKLIFASNRNGKVRGETNLFIANWKD